MTVRPAAGLVIVAAGCLGFAAGAFWHPAAVHGLWALMLAAVWPVTADWLHLRGLRRCALAIRLYPSTVARGVPFSVRTEFSAPAAAPATRWTFRDVQPPTVAAAPDGEVFYGKGAGPHHYERMFRAPVRGEHAFGPLCWEALAPWRFLTARWQDHPRQSVLVVPEAMISPDTVMRREFGEQLLLDQLNKSRLQGEGTEFESLAEYRDGDDPRKLDWRATARSGQLTIRRYQLEQHQHIVIAIDLGRLMTTDGGRGTKLDCAVESALMLARSAIKKGDRCGLLLFDHQVRGWLKPRPGMGAIPEFCAALANVQPSTAETSHLALHEAVRTLHPRRCMLIVLSDLADEDTTLRARAALCALASQHLLLFVGLRSPELQSVIHRLPESGRDVALCALGLEMARQRHRAIHSLARAGVHFMDVEPAALTAPLVSRYIELRQRALL